MKRSLTIILSIMMIIGMIMPIIADPVSTAGTISIGAYLLNLFSTRPQQWQFSTGTIIAEIQVPVEYQNQLSGASKLYPMDLSKQLPGQGQNLCFISGWKTNVFGFFPTGKKDSKAGYYRIDNGTKIKFENAPYGLELPEKDTATHSLEIVIDTGGNSGGSVFITYRFNTLEGYYAEWRANQQFAALSRKAFQNAQPAAPQTAQTAQTVVTSVSTPLSVPETSVAPVVRVSSPAPVPKKYGKVSFQFLCPQGQPEAGKADIEVRSPEGTNSLYKESHNGEWITISVPCDGAARVKPRGSKTWGQWHNVGESFGLQRRGN